MKVKTIKLSTIKPNPSNPRIIKDEKFHKLVKSLETFGEKMMPLRPIVVDENNIILGGNMRFKALKELKYKEVPFDWIKSTNDMTEEEKKEFIIKDNVGFGDWDFDMLSNEWDSEFLNEWGLEIPEFDFEDYTELEAEEDNYEISDEIKTDIVLGDLFEIGEHRLLCGDSTNIDDVEKLMNGETAEVLFTSPPYSDMRQYNGNKDLSINNLIEFIPTFMSYTNYQVINLGIQRKDNEIVEYWRDYIEKAKDSGYKFLSWNIWDRINSGTMAQQTAMFGIVHEWIFVFGKKPKKLNRTLDNKHSDAGKRKYKKVRQSDGTHIKTTSMFYDKKQLNTIFTCKYETGLIRSLHPATFPVELPSEYIKAMTNIQDIVTEPFCGSGSTMVAAHQLKRKCYGMELDPKYCQVIVDRMMKLDPDLVVKRNGVVYEKEKIDV